MTRRLTGTGQHTRARDLYLPQDLPLERNNIEKHQRQAQTPGQPRHSRGDRAGIVHPAASVARDQLSSRCASDQKDTQLAIRPPKKWRAGAL